MYSSLAVEYIIHQRNVCVFLQVFSDEYFSFSFRKVCKKKDRETILNNIKSLPNKYIEVHVKDSIDVNQTE